MKYLYKIKVGDTLESVIERLGKPTTIFKDNEIDVYYYDYETIVVFIQILNDEVIKIIRDIKHLMFWED